MREQQIAGPRVPPFVDRVPDDAALDEALETGFTVLKRMRIEQTWVMKRLAMRRGAAVPMDTRVWSR